MSGLYSEIILLGNNKILLSVINGELKMNQYEKALKLWNIVFWVSIVGLFVTLLLVGFFVQFGVAISWPLWAGIGFYLLGGINAEFWIRTVKKEIKENE